MLYLEAGFRTLYHHFVIFPVNELFQRKLDYFPESRYANAVICYGYYDPFEGMKVSILGAGFFKDGGVQIGEPNNDIEFSISMKELLNYDYYPLDDDPILKQVYAYKLEQLQKFIRIEEMEAIRNFNFLDEQRDPFDIDRILVEFQKKGFITEKLWCKLMGRKEHTLAAVLLENSSTMSELIDGKMIEFYMENREGKEVCVCDVDSLKYYTLYELKDGQVLQNAIRDYNRHQGNGYYFLEVLEIIRQSHFFTGGYEYIDEKNQKGFQLETILNGQTCYLPVYTNETLAKRYLQEEIYEMDLLEIIDLIESSNYKITTIMINPEKEAFVIEEGIWIALKEMIILNQNYN